MPISESDPLATFHIRAMTTDDIPRLDAIRPGFTSETVLDVERTGSGLEVRWQLVERPLRVPYDKRNRYDFDATEQANIRKRLAQGDGLHLVVERMERPGELVGVLDVTPHDWNDTAWIWNLMLDREARGHGLGRELFMRAANWAEQAGFRALCLETQTNNVPACRFYLKMGCRLEGLRETLYTNNDLKRHEVAIFFTYPLY